MRKLENQAERLRVTTSSKRSTWRSTSMMERYWMDLKLRGKIMALKLTETRSNPSITPRVLSSARVSFPTSMIDPLLVARIYMGA